MHRASEHTKGPAVDDARAHAAARDARAHAHGGVVLLDKHLLQLLLDGRGHVHRQKRRPLRIFHHERGVHHQEHGVPYELVDVDEGVHLQHHLLGDSVHVVVHGGGVARAVVDAEGGGVGKVHHDARDVVVVVHVQPGVAVDVRQVVARHRVHHGAALAAPHREGHHRAQVVVQGNLHLAHHGVPFAVVHHKVVGLGHGALDLDPVGVKLLRRARAQRAEVAVVELGNHGGHQRGDGPPHQGLFVGLERLARLEVAPGNIEVFVALHVERHEACLQAGIVEAPAFVVFLAVGTQARIFPSVARLPGSKPHGARHDADLRSTPFLYTSGVHCTRRPHITSSESMKQDRCYCSFLRRYWSQEF
mmetsp:Transcript_39399/g.75485  ORF Transcript_39399/g.75485 Transcript_39399/m.75485 type:complete len:361 (+) Transcript_39399:445-1527(+)